MGLALAGWWMWQNSMKGVYAFLAVFVFTLIWSIWEVGFAFWPMVPRLVAPLFMGAAALLVVPFILRNKAAARPYLIGGVAFAAAFVAYFVMMFQPHDHASSPTKFVSGEVSQVTKASGSNWTSWGKTGEGTRYAPFNQINRDNVANLEVAWTARTGFIADQNKHEQDQHTPLYIDGTIYHCAPVGQITALDGTTGKIKWQFDPKAKSGDWKRCRSLGYFDPGEGDECGPRIVHTTVDAHLISVKASDGKPCESFGEGGTVNQWLGMGDTDPEYLTGSSGPIVANGKIVMGGRVTDNLKLGEPSGVIRAYDAKTGALAWVWDMGQPELKGLPAEGQSYTKGTPNAWSLFSADEDLGPGWRWSRRHLQVKRQS